MTMLSPEARHLVKIADLDGLEQIARSANDEGSIAGVFEDVFAALDARPSTDPETLLEWGRRYIAWAQDFTERDGYPIHRTDWAKRMFDLASEVGDSKLALRVTGIVLGSYAALDKEQRWWMKQQYNLANRA